MPLIVSGIKSSAMPVAELEVWHGRIGHPRSPKAKQLRTGKCCWDWINWMASYLTTITMDGGQPITLASNSISQRNV